MRGWFKIALWQRVLGALVIGVIFGGILSRIMGGEAAADWLETFIKPVGDLFINLIRMLINKEIKEVKKEQTVRK